jgi:hypothetical protein
MRMSQSSAAVSDVVNAVTSVPGAVEAVANAPQTISSIFEVAGRLIYGMGYTAAFAVVFPAALIFAALPKANVLMRGVVDGSAAASQRALRMVG